MADSKKACRARRPPSAMRIEPARLDPAFCAREVREVMKLEALGTGRNQARAITSRLKRLKVGPTGWRLTLFALTCFIVLSTELFSARLVTDQTGRQIDIPEHPLRLISLAPSITETVYALGLGDRLVGDTDFCDVPPEARRKPHVGALLNPSVEKIVELKPDLVLGTPEANRLETAEQLQKLGIPLYGLTAHSVEGTLRSILDLGQVLGREAAALALVANLRRRIEAVEQRVSGQPRPKALFVVWYHPLITVGPVSFIADVIRRAGGVSISDDLRGEYPRLSLEEALHRDPDVILFPGTQSFSPKLYEFERLPGWKDCRAVKNHRLYVISDAINHPSPRLIDALEEVADILHPAAPRDAGAEVRR